MVSAVLNVSFFCIFFMYAFAYIFSYCLRAGRQSAPQSASRGRQIRDVIVSIDYRSL